MNIPFNGPFQNLGCHLKEEVRNEVDSQKTRQTPSPTMLQQELM